MMNKKVSRKLLQITMGILATAPFITGLLGMAGVHNPIYSSDYLPDNTLLDSNLRYLNGFSVGVGLTIYYMIPGIESHTVLLRAICGIIFLGAIGRLISIYFMGLPPFPMPFFVLIEVIAPPSLVFWQNKISVDRSIDL
jgi:hypothetical protein